MTKHVPPPTGEPLAAFDNLAVAVSPAWHQAILRLANAAERVSNQLEWVCSHQQDDDTNGTYVQHCRELVSDLLEFLDGLDADPDLEPSFGQVWGGPDADECEIPEDAEPSLGSFDRMLDQSKAWRAVQGEFIAGLDAEQDDCDHEDSDPAEESEASGIADYDGLGEQVGSQDSHHGWQG